MTVKRTYGCVFLFVLSMAGRLEAQPARVEGVVKGPDEIPIRGAYVLIEQSRFTAVTDLQGRFAIEGPEIGFTGTISVTYPEYRQEKRKITLTEPVTSLTFTMQPRIKPPPILAPEVPFVSTGPTNRVTLSPTEASTLPSLGQKDALRAMQLLPSVMREDTSSALAVRGGGPDETLTRLDGITLYDLDRAFGYMSALDMNAVESVQLAAGPLDTRTSGRLSGSTEIAGRSGDLIRAGGNAAINLLDASGLIEVPFRGKGSALASARRTYPSGFSKWMLSLVDGQGGKKDDAAPGTSSVGGPLSSEPTAEFLDLHGKVLFQPKAGSRTSLTVYRGKEDLDLSRDTRLPIDVSDLFFVLGIVQPAVFGTTELRHSLQTGVGAGWSQVWSNRVQSEFSLGRTTYENGRIRTNTLSAVANTLNEFGATEERVGRGTLSLTLGGGNAIDVGGEIGQYDLQYSLKNTWTPSTALDLAADLRDPAFTFARNVDGRLASVFVQHRLAIQNRASLMPGVRFTRLDRTGEWYKEPHISGRAYFNEAVSVHGAWSRASQFVMQLEREDLLRGNGRFWTMADGASVPVMTADEFSAGATVSSPAILVDVRAFKKEYTDVTLFAPVAVTATALATAANPLARGSAKGHGIEALVQHKVGPNTAWVSYTNARHEQLFRSISTTAFRPGHYREMELKVADVARFGAFTLGGVYTWSKGRPYTPIVHSSRLVQPPTPEGEETPPAPVLERTLAILPRNSGRFPNHHRLDVSFTRGIRVAGRASMIGASVINLYDRANPWYKEFTSIEGEIIETDILMMARAFNVFWTIRF